jgi:hypothetical protein
LVVVVMRSADLSLQFLERDHSGSPFQSFGPSSVFRLILRRKGSVFHFVDVAAMSGGEEAEKVSSSDIAVHLLLLVCLFQNVARATCDGCINEGCPGF